jgi:hypothetical protein
MSNALEYRMIRRRINVSPGFLYAAMRAYDEEKIASSTGATRPLFIDVVVEVPANLFNGEFDGDYQEGRKNRRVRP